MLVKPAPGLKVRRPDTFELLPDDAWTPVADDDLHWVRALRDGDVVAQPAAKPAAAPKKPAPARKAKAAQAPTSAASPAAPTPAE